MLNCYCYISSTNSSNGDSPVVGHTHVTATWDLWNRDLFAGDLNLFHFIYISLFTSAPKTPLIGGRIVSFWLMTEDYQFHSHCCGRAWLIGSSDSGSTRYWPPGSQHTLGAGSHIQQRDCLFMWIKIIYFKYMLWRLLTSPCLLLQISYK